MNNANKFFVPTMKRVTWKSRRVNNNKGWGILMAKLLNICLDLLLLMINFSQGSKHFCSITPLMSCLYLINSNFLCNVHKISFLPLLLFFFSRFCLIYWEHVYKQKLWKKNIWSKFQTFLADKLFSYFKKNFLNKILFLN